MEVPVEDLPRFHCYVLPPSGSGYRGDPIALQMNAEIIAKVANYQKLRDKNDLLENYLIPEHVCPKIKEFLNEQNLRLFVNPRAVVAAGKNFSNFDKLFLQNLPQWDIRFKHRTLDPMMYFIQSDDIDPPDLRTCKYRARLGSEVAHTAIEDCYDVIKLIRIGIKRLPLMT